MFVRFIELFESEASTTIGHQLIDVSCHGYHHSFLQSDLGSGMQRISVVCCCIVYVLATIVSEGRSADKYANYLNIGNLRLAAMNTCRFIHSFQICCRLCENDIMNRPVQYGVRKTFCGTLYQHIYSISCEKYHDIWWTSGSRSVCVCLVTLIRNLVVIW